MAIGFPTGLLFFLRKTSNKVGFLAANREACCLEAFLEFSHGEFGEVFAFVSSLFFVFGVKAKASWLVNFDEGDFSAIHSVSNDGDQSELHHGSVGGEKHGLRNGDVEVIAIKGHAEITVSGV